MDIVTPEQRSKNMAAIRSKNTKPEVYFRKLLFAKGYRYSLNSKRIPGHPDIYLKKYNTTVFVHGCFWHRHAGCRFSYMPKSRIEFWQKKFEANQKRDSRDLYLVTILVAFNSGYNRTLLHSAYRKKLVKKIEGIESLWQKRKRVIRF